MHGRSKDQVSPTPRWLEEGEKGGGGDRVPNNERKMLVKGGRGRKEWKGVEERR